METEKAPQQKSEKTCKDTFFKKLLREKERAIEVLNALEGTNYSKNASAKILELEKR